MTATPTTSPAAGMPGAADTAPAPTDGAALTDRQLDLLRRRLEAQPQAFREMFIEDGMAAVIWEFSQPELSEDFTRAFWEVLRRGDDASRVLMRFVWGLPLSRKRSIRRRRVPGKKWLQRPWIKRRALLKTKRQRRRPRWLKK